MINELIKKLRKAADILDELMDSVPADNKKTAGIIRRKVDKQLKKNSWNMGEMSEGKSTPFLAKWKEANEKQAESRLNRKKPHWTQTPEGKVKMAAAQKKSWAKRKAAK